jgi:sulfate adenylyltransferase large subunit
MRQLLRICTAGSVDDGKSTLIGRLLYESRTIYEDQVQAVQTASRHRGVGPLDFSLFTDGLRAEREQGITIDVAYRYFATARRSFVLADTPGHDQYTRNMATGASTADVAILLVDAHRGSRPQSRRHARIARLLGISEFVLAVNKMDLVEFDRSVFDAIVGEFRRELSGARVHAVPVSALHGDNVTTRSPRTPWYEGPDLLGYLETVDVKDAGNAGAFRYAVQLVVRPDSSFRGYAGRILAGTVHVGDAVAVWPSGTRSTVARIVTRDGDLAAASAPLSIVLTLADEIDVGRGETIAVGVPQVGTCVDAQVVWMDERPMAPDRPYRLKHTTQTVTATVDRALQLNEIGEVRVSTSRPLVYEPYARTRAMGSFVLIDPTSHFTAGAGMILRPGTETLAGSNRRAVAARLVAAARDAGSEADAVGAVERALAELLP